MATLLSVHQLKKSFGSRPLFNNLTFSIHSGERVGLIGPNGAGKSTLLKILSGLESQDGGTVSFAKGTRVAYLEQSPQFTEDDTILSYVQGESEKLLHLEDWEALINAQEWIAKLSLNTQTINGEMTLMRELSGGLQKRAAIARALATKPDLFMLDEPTNHLDVEGILWLEEFLTQSSECAQMTTIVVTHDRLFLQRIANRIIELDKRNPDGILSVPGDYTAYLAVKEERLANQERREIVLKNTLRRETEWLRRGAKARTTKQQARIERAGELKEEVSQLEFRNQYKTAKIEFKGLEKNPKRLLSADEISKSFGEKKLFESVSLTLAPGMRVGLLGPNGAGKSTLIKTLLGLLPPDSGSIEKADKLEINYFEQHREALDPDLSILETICPRGDFVEFNSSRIHVRGYLDRFLFTPEQFEMDVGHLSGGEQSRLLIAKLMLTKANILVLDEPTNDLDMATLNVLEECLKEFPGALILVSHDRYFLDQVSTHILAFEDKKLVPYASIEQWENSIFTKKNQPTQKNAAKEAAGSKKTSGGKFSYNEQREFDGMEEKIHSKEKELEVLNQECLLDENVRNSKKLHEITVKIDKLRTEIEGLYLRWDELSQRKTN